MQHGDHNYEGDTDCDSSDDTVARNRIRGRLTRPEREQPDTDRPDDAACGVPAEERPPPHTSDSGHPRAGDTNATEETGKEDRFAAVPLEEAFRRRHHSV